MQMDTSTARKLKAQYWDYGPRWSCSGNDSRAATVAVADVYESLPT